MHRIFSHHESHTGTREESPVTECKSGLSGRLYIGEIVDKALVGYKRNTSLVVLHSATKEDSQGVEGKSTHQPVKAEGVLVLTFHLTHVLPGNTLGVGSVFTEPVGQPGVTSEVLSQELHVVILLLLGGHSCRLHF